MNTLNFLQFVSIPYADVAQTLFMGGTTISNGNNTSFETITGNIRVLFQGTGLTYGTDGSLTGGILARLAVYQGGAGAQTALIAANSNFTLPSAAELGAAFGLASGGDPAAAVALVSASWVQEYFWHTNYSGGYLKGYAGGDALNGAIMADQIHGNGGNDSLLLNTGNDKRIRRRWQ